MFKLPTFCFVFLFLASINVEAQRAIGRGQSPLTGRGGGSPLGPSGSGSITTTNSPSAGYVLTTDGTIYYWGVNTTQITNLPAYVLTNFHSVDAVFNAGLAINGTSTNNQIAYFNDDIRQLYTNTAEFGGVYARQFLVASNVTLTGRITNSTTSGGGFWTADSAGFVSISSPTDYILLSHPQGGIVSTLDGWTFGLSGVNLATWSTNTSTIRSNFLVDALLSARNLKLIGGQTASSLLRLDSNTNLATVTIGANLSFDGTTLSSTGGGGNASNFFDVNITNTLQRTVWRAGNITNLTIPWSVTNRVIWTPSNAPASIAMSGTHGGNTNEQIIHVTVILTNAGITSLVMPTNGIDGLPPFFLTAPSTNEFDFVYNGDLFYIVSYQSPSTGVGQTAVLQTNPVVYNATLTVTNASTNLITLLTEDTSPTTNDMVMVHDRDTATLKQVAVTNLRGSSSGGSSNFVTSAHGSAHITNGLRLGSVTYSNDWQLHQEGSRIRRQATAKEGSTTIDNHGFASFIATGTAQAFSASSTNNSRVNTYSAASANADAGYEVNSGAVRPGFENRIHGVATIVSTTNQTRVWWALSSDTLSALTDRDMPSTKHVIGLRFNSETNSNWWFVAANGSSATNIDTGVAVQGGGYRARISLIENVTPTTTNWVAWINGIPVATNTALLPTQPMKWIGSIRTFDAAAKTNAFEYLEHTAAP